MKIALIGYGKMGKAIEKQALTKGHEIVLRINKGNLKDLSAAHLKRADVGIEFSRPETAFSNIVFCLKHQLPVISGTTGWLDQLSDVKDLCQKEKGAFLYASNFSIGVNILFALNKYLGKLMESQPQYDVSIEEIHHTQKVDYPSGTAITLAEGALEHSVQKESWTAHLDTAQDQPVQDHQLAILSKRIDKVPGTHFVKWQSAIDQIEINHVAHSREGFAAGALAAAEWIIGKQGSFEMKDMLGF